MKIWLSILFITFSYTSFSQTPQIKAIEDLIEEIANSSDYELDYTTLVEDLNYFYQNPISINNTNKEQLEKLHLLNDFQIHGIIAYTIEYGRFYTIYELQLIPGFDSETIFKLIPFISVDESLKSEALRVKDALKYGRHQVFLRGQQVIEEQEGFSDISDSLLAAKPNSRYLGSPYKLYARYKFNYRNKLSFGITAEKDAGEEFFTETQKQGFDYYSTHLQLNDIGIVKTAILGDYHIQFGQGLTFWSGMGFGKSPYVLNVNKHAAGIKKYSSTDENRFLRGAATTIDYKNFQVTTFFSKKKIDANISDYDTINNEINAFTSFQTTGLHSTPGEIFDKNAIGEMIFGGSVSYNAERYKVGLNFAHSQFNVNQVDNTTPYRIFDTNTSGNSNLGVDYQISLNDINLFGETAIGNNGKFASLNGALLSVNSQVQLVCLHRYYDKAYSALYASGFSENSQTKNENGLYFGALFFPYKNWKLSAYFDNFSFPWLKFGVNAPSGGYDYMAQADYTPSRDVSMYLRIKQEIKDKNISESIDKITDIEEVNTFKIRYHITYKISDKFEFRDRIEYSGFNRNSTGDEKGYLMYHDIIFKPERKPFSFAFRYAIFDTDSWDTRIYAYENDILYAFSIPAYYSKGMRTYLTTRYRVSNNLDIWLRYSRTVFADKTEISTGLNKINGNTKSEVKVQLRFRF